MKILCVFVVFGLAGCLGDNTSDSKTLLRPSAALKKNLTALHRIKSQIHKIVDRTKIGGPKRKLEAQVEQRDQPDQARVKRKTNKDNLDNLLPTLAIRSVNVNVDWFSFAKTANVSQVGTSFVLSDGRSLVAHVMNIGNVGNYYTIPSLEQDRVYRGEVKILTQKEEVKNFIRKQSNRKNAEEFELTTPFIVPDDDVKKILEARELLERRQKQHPQTIKVNYIDIKLTFSKIEKLGYTVDVSRYYSEGNNSMLSAPEQTIELLPPVKEVVLSDYQPHELLRVSLKNVRENEEDGEIFFSTVHTVNIFTGSVYRMGMANFSRALDAETVAELQSARLNGSAKLAHLKNFRSVRCYADDDVFSGYPCHESDTCIPLDWVCDGEPDCRSHDDERHCDDDYSGHDSEFPYRGGCRKYEFRCRARGESVCLPNSWLCDGRIDCTDGWDEDAENCYESFKQLRPGYTKRKEVYDTKACGHNYFRCWDGKDCAALRDVCDGNEDCTDGSDERICETSWRLLIVPGTWDRTQGTNPVYQVIQLKMQKKGERTGGKKKVKFKIRWKLVSVASSESVLGRVVLNVFCYKSTRPSNGRVSRSCIPRSWVCDDQEDCAEGEDESARVCDNYNKFSFSSNILKPFGIGFEISTGFKKK